MFLSFLSVNPLFISLYGSPLLNIQRFPVDSTTAFTILILKINRGGVKTRLIQIL